MLKQWQEKAKMIYIASKLALSLYEDQSNFDNLKKIVECYEESQEKVRTLEDAGVHLTIV